MSIQNKEDAGKTLTGDISFDSLQEKNDVHVTILLILLLIFSGLSAFGLGRLSVREAQNQRGVVIKTIAPEFRSESEGAPAVQGGEVEKGEMSVPETPFLVGSKNSDKYHFPWCSGAKRIKQENLVSFGSYEEARRAGYTPASNCDGLK